MRHKDRILVGNKNRKILVIAALESEFKSSENFQIPIYYSGVGKINAARLTTELIINYDPDLIINVGTAGSLQQNLEGFIHIRDVVEHDMNAFPLAPRGVVPFELDKSKFSSVYGEYRCATGDSFITAVDPWLVASDVDVVDMELFSIAKVCCNYGIEWLSIKYISDYTNDSSGDEWLGSLNTLSREFEAKILDVSERIL